MEFQILIHDIDICVCFPYSIHILYLLFVPWKETKMKVRLREVTALLKALEISIYEWLMLTFLPLRPEPVAATLWLEMDGWMDLLV